MKKITLSLIALISLNTFAVAGGDITPVEPRVNVPAFDEMSGKFYVGMGYSNISVDYTTGDDAADSVLFLAGYNFNDYIGVEGRYSAENSDGMSNAALYLKGMYPVGAVNLYMLAGYGKTEIDNFSESGLQWGLGASYAVLDNVNIFVDYTTMYDDKGFDTLTAQDVKVDAISVGANYKF